jgi:hypothetical protein
MSCRQGGLHSWRDSNREVLALVASSSTEYDLSMAHAEALVFVDDYVMGRLPEVCAVTGHRTDDQIRIRSRIDQLSWAATILLMFLGPLGWLALLVMAMTGPTLTGWLPYSVAEAVRRKEHRRFVVIGTVGGVLGLLLLASVLDAPVFASLALPLLVLAAIALGIQLYREPRIGLDASGRWVTIRRAHPNFVAAVNASRDHDRSLPRL